MLLGGCLQHVWPHDRAHYFFARARWEIDQLGLAVAQLVALLVLPPGADLRVAVDDSVFRRSGRKVHGAGWQLTAAPRRRTSSATATARGRGHLVRLRLLREIGLPVLAGCTCRQGRRAVQGGDGRGLVRLLALASPAGWSISWPTPPSRSGAAHPPENVTWTCGPRNAVLYDLAPPRTGSAAARTKGGRPAPPMTSPPPRPGHGHAAYRREDIKHVAEVTCLWYGSWHTRTVG